MVIIGGDIDKYIVEIPQKYILNLNENQEGMKINIEIPQCENIELINDICRATIEGEVKSVTYKGIKRLAEIEKFSYDSTDDNSPISIFAIKIKYRQHYGEEE